MRRVINNQIYFVNEDFMKRKAILYAILAAVFYAINTPVSKLLLGTVPATYMASFLRLGAKIIHYGHANEQRIG